MLRPAGCLSSFPDSPRLSDSRPLPPACAFHPEQCPSHSHLVDSHPMGKLQTQQLPPPRSPPVMHSHRCIITWAVAVSDQELHMEGGDSNHWLPWSGLLASIDVQPIVHTSLSVIYFPSLCTPSGHHAQSTCTQTTSNVHPCAYPSPHSPHTCHTPPGMLG